MKPTIEYDSNWNRFLLKGVLDREIPFSISVDYLATVKAGTAKAARAPGFTAIENGWRNSMAEVDVELEWHVKGNGVEITVSVENVTDNTITLANISPAIFDLGDVIEESLSNYYFYQHGFQSWTPSRPVIASSSPQYPRIKSFGLMNQNVDSKFWKRDDGLISSLFTVLKKKSDNSGLFAGFLNQQTGLGEFFLRNRWDKQLIASLDYSQKTLAPGERLITEPLQIRYAVPEVIIPDYMNELGSNMAARVAESSPVGWCSWYEFYTSVKEQNIIENSEVLSRHKDLNVEFVQLDDGYQQAVGDWLELNDKFPSGLEKIASDIHEKGFKAGIWLAPFLAARKSQLYKTNPGWFLKNKAGKPVDCGYNPSWKSRVYALDLTNPEVAEWLKDLFESLVSFGFDYFKLDFIFAGIRHGSRHKPELSPLESYRSGLEIIRKAVGDRFILGCGAPVGASVGLVDGMRVSEDVKEVWTSPFWEWLGRGCGVPSASGSLRNNIQRHYTHRRLWLNDPDCLLVRGHNTKLSEREVRTMVTLLGMTGGMLFLSDDMKNLSEKSIGLVKNVLPPANGSASPENQFNLEFPQLFQMTGESSSVLALTNWKKKSATFDLSEIIPDGNLLFDFWSSSFWDRIPVKIQPHATFALQVTRRNGFPSVAGTNLHLTALADGNFSQEFNEKENVLSVKSKQLAKSKGRVWIAIPEGYTYLAANCEGEHMAVTTWKEGVAVSITKPAPWELSIKFFKKT